MTHEYGHGHVKGIDVIKSDLSQSIVSFGYAIVFSVTIFMCHATLLDVTKGLDSENLVQKELFLKY